MRPKRILTALALVAVGLAIQPVYAAITQSRVVLTAQDARDVATELNAAYIHAKAFVAYNSSQSIDWANLDTEDPGIDANGLVEGEDYTPAEVSNAIGTYAAFITLVEAGHLGNLHKLASP